MTKVAVKSAVPQTAMDHALDIFEHISIPGKGIESHLVIVEGKIGSIPHKDILRALECHDALVQALEGIQAAAAKGPVFNSDYAMDDLRMVLAKVKGAA